MGSGPDLVVFYDGVNDTFSGYQSQVAGHTQNEFNRRREFNLTHPRRIADLRTESLVQSYGTSSTSGPSEPCKIASAHLKERFRPQFPTSRLSRKRSLKSTREINGSSGRSPPHMDLKAFSFGNRRSLRTNT